MNHVEFDLSDLIPDDLTAIDFSEIELATIYIPLPSIGRTSSHIDICSDYVDASWTAETLAATARSAKVEEEYIRSSHTTRLKLTLTDIQSEFREKLSGVVLIYQGECDDEESGRYKEIRDAIADYEESLPQYKPLLPELVDSYFANLVSGAYHEMQSEAPDYYAEEIGRYPERELGFHLSAYSHRIGGNCYVSPDSWLIPGEVSPDTFFERTGQNYRLNDFIRGEVLVVAGKSYVVSEGLVTYFPMSQYFKSRVCASFARRHDEDMWPPDQFAWPDASFTHSPFAEFVRGGLPEGIRAPGPQKEVCLVHNSGTLIILDDGHYRHILYDTKPLNAVATKNLYEGICDAAQSVASAVGLSNSPALDWNALTDEQFEQLCYDVIYDHPKFDSSTIRKMGSSRSRDGGRDIEVHEVPRNPGAPRRKWIFQCKLTQSKSLGATKVTDVGDMLDQYDADGFGVMTSTLIDATLYDKLDSVCCRRKVEQLHFSILELDRALIRNASVRRRYFPDS